MYNYKDLMDKDRKYLWHPFTQMKTWNEEEQMIIVKGEGNKVYDMQGNGYIDAYSSLWCNVHGHNIPELNQAITEQLDSIAHSTMLGAANVPAILLAEKLVEISPIGLNKVFYSDSGATAVEIALKMAYQYWKQATGKVRNKFITFENAYHGDTIGSVSLGGISIFHEIFKGLLFETVRVPNTYAYRMGDDISLEKAGAIVLGEIEKALNENEDKIAAIVVEPKMFGAAGMVTQPAGFVKSLRNLADKYGTLLICDEVATGFARTGGMFASTDEGICPDIMAVAKGITGGYLPVAATLTTDEIYNAFLGEPQDLKTFYHGHTYTGNQLGCAVSIANIDLMIKNDTVGYVKEISGYMGEKLDKLNELDCVGEIRRKGVMTGIEIVKDKKTKEPFAYEDLAAHNIIINCRKYGVLTRNLGDVVILNPVLSVTKDEIDIILNALYDSIKSVTEK